jgi:hypothetical protein
MSDPASMGDPASMTASQYVGGSADGGGVHTNSGVGNKAAYLIATGLGAGTTEREGIVKAAHIYYGALKALPSGADYADLAAALQTSCTTIAGTPLRAKLSASDPETVTFPLADCAVVDSAIAATAMTAQPTSLHSSAPEAPLCPDGSAPVAELFSDDMENPSFRPWTNLPSSSVLPDNAYADYFDASRYGASYAHSGRTSLVAFSSVSGSTTAASGTARIQTSAAVPIPAGKQTFLWFAHAGDLTDGLDDGVRVSAAVGTVATDLGGPLDGGAPAKNGYNVGNLTGRPGGAFNGDTHGYMSSRFDLTPFAGKSIKPTFDLLGDGSGESAWWLDDVRIYTCDGAAPSPVKSFTATPTTPQPPTGPTTATVTWTAPEFAGTSGVRDYTVAVTPAVSGFPQTGVTGTSVPVTELDPAKAYTFTVTANATDGTPGTASTVEVVPPTTTLARTPAAPVYGQRVTLSGTVSGGTKPLGGVPVLVEARPKGTSAWTALATTRSGSTGRWAAVHVPTRTYEYRATPQAAPANWAATGAWTAKPGTAVAVPVSWKVAASFVASTIKRGTTAQLRVGVAPARYASLELQRKVGTRWVVVQRAKSTSRGTAVLSAKHTTAGRFAYRVIVRSDAYYVLAASGAYGLTVK